MSSSKKKVQIDAGAQRDDGGSSKEEKGSSKRVIKSVVPKLQKHLLGLAPLRTLAVRELKGMLEGVCFFFPFYAYVQSD